MRGASGIKVLLADDHGVVREGLKRLLESESEINVIGEASNGEEAITKAVALSPDVIVMDLKMPGMDGIAATREIKQILPNVEILMLTLYGEGFVSQAIEAGVSGYILKDSHGEQITKAIHQVYDGLSPISPSLSRNLVMEFAKLSGNSRSILLTDRQTEILKMIAEGVLSIEIANQLFLSPSTVKRELRIIFNKLGANDRAQAVSQAIKQNLI